MRGIYLLLVLCMTFGLKCEAQDSPATHSALIEIGMTRLQARQASGIPSAVYAHDTHNYYPVEQEDGLRKLGWKLNDVWDRKTPHNEFRISALYAYDFSTSRLHPIERLIKLTFTPDQDELASGLLNEISEARVLCRQGCEVYGKRDGYTYEMYVCRGTTRGSNAEMMAAGSFSAWNEYLDGQAYALCAIILYSNTPTHIGITGRLPPAKKIDWKSFTVGSVEMTGMLTSLIFKKSDSEFMSTDFVLKLDDWHPY